MGFRGQVIKGSSGFLCLPSKGLECKIQWSMKRDLHMIGTILPCGSSSYIRSSSSSAKGPWGHSGRQETLSSHTIPGCHKSMGPPDIDSSRGKHRQNCPVKPPLFSEGGGLGRKTWRSQWESKRSSRNYPCGWPIARPGQHLSSRGPCEQAWGPGTNFLATPAQSGTPPMSLWPL